jgi:hypothetical protein
VRSGVGVHSVDASDIGACVRLTSYSRLLIDTENVSQILPVPSLRPIFISSRDSCLSGAPWGKIGSRNVPFELTVIIDCINSILTGEARASRSWTGGLICFLLKRTLSLTREDTTQCAQVVAAQVVADFCGICAWSGMRVKRKSRSPQDSRASLSPGFEGVALTTVGILFAGVPLTCLAADDAFAC